ANKRNTLVNTRRGMIMESLQDSLRELRRQMGLTQEELAHKIDVSLSTIQRWEKQGGRPTRLARRELSRIFREARIK
ncbi:helix-turn-helix transcriptional regulator, partial [Chloroflexota bacterium]